MMLLVIQFLDILRNRTDKLGLDDYEQFTFHGRVPVSV